MKENITSRMLTSAKILIGKCHHTIFLPILSIYTVLHMKAAVLQCSYIGIIHFQQISRVKFNFRSLFVKYILLKEQIPQELLEWNKSHFKKNSTIIPHRTKMTVGPGNVVYCAKVNNE